MNIEKSEPAPWHEALVKAAGTIKDKSNLGTFKDVCVILIKGANTARAKMKQIDEMRGTPFPVSAEANKAMVDAAVFQFKTLGVDEIAARNLAEKIYEGVG